MEDGFVELQACLAELLIKERVRRGITQEELALMANVDRSYVSRIERGIANPSLRVLHNLADVMDATLELKFLASKK